MTGIHDDGNVVGLDAGEQLSQLVVRDHRLGVAQLHVGGTQQLILAVVLIAVAVLCLGAVAAEVEIDDVFGPDLGDEPVFHSGFDIADGGFRAQQRFDITLRKAKLCRQQLLRHQHVVFAAAQVPLRRSLRVVVYADQQGPLLNCVGGLGLQCDKVQGRQQQEYPLLGS